jgi:lysophospholipase L1-like esterase
MVSPLEENFADRYHPNDKGYLEMADMLIPRLNELIK